MASFLALGDSYTIGEGIAESERWPIQLASRLRAQRLAVEDPRIIARTGWTTDELSAAMDVAALHPSCALVTLAVGVNNQYRGRPLDEYRAQFRALLTRAITLAAGDARRVIVVSIPDWGVTPFARGEGRDAQQVAAQIDAFNAVAHDEADAVRARFVDVTGISRAPDVRGLLAADGLHPSGAQYARWLEVIAPVAREVLMNPSA
ncbi:MAG TPA: SGNH/GDSL hydrolase family protein [Rhodanobacteraceae bacterium]|nr:SGNH/GDSL hydrolase family protein [Rhodanobacteraceae bacterium]